MKARKRIQETEDCGSAPTHRDLLSLNSIVRAYQRFNRSRLVGQLDSFKREPTLGAAVARAALAQRPDGKRYGHQRRISPNTLKKVRKRLPAKRCGSCRNFSELYDLIETNIGTIRGVGSLMVYDTALRIGAKLRVWPERVYLHRGTRLGARALGLKYWQPTLELSELPQALRTLRPHEIEDLLCIYDKELSRFRAG